MSDTKRLENRAKLYKNSGEPDGTERGIWMVEGADQNVDLGGGHFRPVLAHFEGAFNDVVTAALELSGMYVWGQMDGKLIKIDAKKV